MKIQKVQLIFLAGLIVLALFVLSYFRSDRRKFENSLISSKVIDTSDWLSHARTFYLEDGFSIDFMFPINDRMRLNDSVFKEKGTSVYQVYRLNTSGEYYEFATYDYRKVD